MKYLNIIFAFMLFFMFAAPVNSTTWNYNADEYEVLHCPSSYETLTEQWEWASDRAKKISGGFWVGYSIERLMSPNSYICHSRSGSWDDEPTLEMILTGDFTQKRRSIKEEAELSLKRLENKDYKVVKEVAILFYFSGAPIQEKNIHHAAISNISRYFDLEDRPLLWLGLSKQNNSVDFLKDMYGRLRDEYVKEDMITVIGIHTGTRSNIPFLKEIIKKEKDTELREDAVFWLSQQGDDSVLDFLVDLAENDKTEDVREQAVFAISQIETEKAADALIDLAKNSRDYEVSKKAIFWLGQIASKKALPYLEDVAYSDEKIELQKQAVFALSQLEDGDGVSALIKIIKTHPSREVRKKAIFWLGESEDPRALDVLVDIVKSK